MDSFSSGRPFDKACPSGLLLALLLAQNNIPSVVLESWPHLDTRLRATQYGVPATRVFRRAGILEDIRKASIAKFPSICWRRVSDHQKLIGLDLSLVEDDPDRMTILPLGEIIQILYRHCLERGGGLIDVRFNHEVTNVGQDDNSAYVDVNIKGQGTTKTERLAADYVVGCDGASSAVRRSLFGREWPGQTLPYRFVVQNVYYDGFQNHNWDGGNYMVDNDHWGLIARRGKGGLWRVTYGDPVTGLTDEEYLARRPAHMKAMLPGHPDPDQYRIEQTNLYNIHNRCAESFKVGRVILAGDAAHVCNPMGGYGCMTAVLDVGGLADCFIGYYHGLSDEDILDKYAEIRRDIFIRYVDPRSIKNLNRVATSDPHTVLDTDKFFGILKDLQKDEESMRAFLLCVCIIVKTIFLNLKPFFPLGDSRDSHISTSTALCSKSIKIIVNHPTVCFIKVIINMRLDITAVLASLALTVFADRMEVFTSCGGFTCNSSDAWFYTDYGTYKVNANKGCRGTSVPAMVEFCVDWDNRRAHFRFSGQVKRCMVQDSESAYGCAATCYETTWREIPCNWRMASEENPATEIASSAFVTMTKAAGN
ncbi:3-(3-hydroxyphenyl)propionate 2-hydroxylase [Fusarium sp. NRRL 25303]|nr:3-(3-hydroxyphenyl)propionate 2-hydroxylase [Fusarium sp. NRRL 25303]